MSATFSATDRRCMRRALELARTAFGRTSPNPCVGAVLWKKGRVIGEGYHRGAGKPHAEVEAVRDAKRRGHDPRGATIYVTLEPCSTVGRMPACTGLIVREGIARVVAAAVDPNPLHAGGGYAVLRAAGVRVATGLMAEESNRMNRAFNHFIVTRRPWVTAKIALSLDGKIAPPPGHSPWLTSEAARRTAHLLRWECDAILVGGETARADNPRLTVRLPGKRKPQPWRIVWSRKGQLPRSLHLFSDAHRERTRVVTARAFPSVLKELGGMEVTHLLLEGGGGVLTAALASGLVNEVAFFLAPQIQGSLKEALTAALSHSLELKEPAFERLGPDLFCRCLCG
ncbi:MAG: bifunctional diaminohydroxyphosphoribosylaminopyrimidine deaminase/5-amino-6-(5-phosphoribosylamino)uracil reductase RibD [Verrucomicrobium sp.]|nr:bifunctional diaminohydroxyphosphoribosylaminopyrimidine deaminase/5-amino-6-(5-phosphoribosylamino)uracil reductase RibD [Verrucomicrobium sp.]